VSSLPKAVTWKRTGRDSKSRPLGSRANALPLSHTGHEERNKDGKGKSKLKEGDSMGGERARERTGKGGEGKKGDMETRTNARRKKHEKVSAVAEGPRDAVSQLKYC